MRYSLTLWLAGVGIALLGLNGPVRGDLTVIPIGVVNILSGPQATFGHECQQGIELAAQEGALALRELGYELKFFHGDSKGEAREGVSEFQRLLGSNKLWAVVVARSNVAMAINPLSERAKVPLLGGAGHSRLVSDNPYAFRFFLSASQEGPALASMSWQMGARRVALVTAEDEHPLSLRESYKSDTPLAATTTVAFKML